MSSSEIENSIASLRSEVAKLSESDVDVKTKLLALIEDMERHVESASSPSSEASRDVTALIEQFESDHPKVTNALGELLTTLSSMGV